MRSKALPWVICRQTNRPDIKDLRHGKTNISLFGGVQIFEEKTIIVYYFDCLLFFKDFVFWLEGAHAYLSSVNDAFLSELFGHFLHKKLHVLKTSCKLFKTSICVFLSPFQELKKCYPTFRGQLNSIMLKRILSINKTINLKKPEIENFFDNINYVLWNSKVCYGA